MANAIKTDFLIEQIERISQSCQDSGWSVEINDLLPTVAIIDPEGETQWFFQEHEASDLLDSVPDDCAAEDYLLWSCQGW